MATVIKRLTSIPTIRTLGSMESDLIKVSSPPRFFKSVARRISPGCVAPVPLFCGSYGQTKEGNAATLSNSAGHSCVGTDA